MATLKPSFLLANPFDTPEAALDYQHWWESPAELGGFRLEQARKDIYFPPWNVPGIRWWGRWFERLGSCLGHGGARRIFHFRRA